MGGRGGASAASGGGVSAADKAIRDASGGVILSDNETVINATATKKNKRASTTYDKTVMSASVDSDGNITLDYAKGSYDGYYGDPVQNVEYKIKAGFVDGSPVNMDLSKATSISGKNTYSVREAAKEAGMVWNPKMNMYLKKDHPLNVNTKASSNDLKKMSDNEIDRMYRAVFYKAYSGAGHSLPYINSKAKKLPQKSRSEKIATIEKFNEQNK